MSGAGNRAERESAISCTGRSLLEGAIGPAPLGTGRTPRDDCSLASSYIPIFASAPSRPPDEAEVRPGRVTRGRLNTGGSPTGAAVGTTTASGSAQDAFENQGQYLVFGEPEPLADGK